MSLFRPNGLAGEVTERRISPGDVLAGGENILNGALATVGAGTWTGAMIATGIIRRTGPVGGYTDTTDTAANIIAALAGNASSPDVLPGTSFRMLFLNTVAQAMTWAAGTGVVTGTGTLNCAASSVREYLVTVLNSSATTILQAGVVNTSANLTFVLSLNRTSIPFQGSDGTGLSNLVGASISDGGVNIPANTFIIGVIEGQGGVTGVVMSAAATGTLASFAATIGPRVQFDALTLGTL